MSKKQGINFFIGIGLLVVFTVWTLLVQSVDVAPIGPEGSTVGFATLNGYFHKVIGTNMTLYVITDWLGLIPILTASFFAFLGFVQLIKRKSIIKVDRSIIVLGIFYIAVIFVFFFFERVVINYRPVLIEGVLEASYPSSTTMLVTSVMSTAIAQCRERVKNKFAMRVLCILISVFTVFMVLGRVISGVHWITDIIGGLLVSSGLFFVYVGAAYKRNK